MRDQLVFARVLAEGLAVLEQRHEIGGLGDDSLQGVGHLVNRRLPGFDLAREASHEAALELAVVALGVPRSGIHRSDQRDAVPQEDLGVCTRGRPA